MTARELADPARLFLLEISEAGSLGELRPLLARGLAGVLLEGPILDDREALAEWLRVLRAAAPTDPPPLVGVRWDTPALADLLPQSAALAWEFLEAEETLEVQLQALQAGRELVALGFNHVRGPALDLDRREKSGPADPHLFGQDVDLVATVGALVVEALQASGLLCSALAFPGRGALERADAGPGISNVGVEDLLRIDAAPFLAAAARGLEMLELSTGFYRDFGEEPATCSAKLCQWLIGEVGFGGVIVSAPLRAIAGHEVGEAARHAFEAGCHLLQLPLQDFERAEQALLPTTQTQRTALGRRAGRSVRLRRDWLD